MNSRPPFFNAARAFDSTLSCCSSVVNNRNELKTIAATSNFCFEFQLQQVVPFEGDLLGGEADEFGFGTRDLQHRFIEIDADHAMSRLRNRDRRATRAAGEHEHIAPSLRQPRQQKPDVGLQHRQIGVLVVVKARDRFVGGHLSPPREQQSVLVPRKKQPLEARHTPAAHAPAASGRSPRASPGVTCA